MLDSEFVRMSKYERDVEKIVNAHGTITVMELARMLSVTDQTIRRIVKPLEARGILKKVHGALVSNENLIDPPFLTRMNTQKAAKSAIARKVVELIKDGSSLAIDTGSTSGFVARELRSKRNLSIVTNSAFIASTLSMVEGNRVFMAGNQLRNHDGAAFDKTAFEMIANVSVDFSILSASGAHPIMGFLGYEQCEVEIATAMIDISQRTIMAVDKTKFSIEGSLPPIRFPKLRPDDIVITDGPLGDEYSTFLTDQQLIFA